MLWLFYKLMFHHVHANERHLQILNVLWGLTKSMQMFCTSLTLKKGKTENSVIIYSFCWSKPVWHFFYETKRRHILKNVFYPYTIKVNGAQINTINFYCMAKKKNVQCACATEESKSYRFGTTWGFAFVLIVYPQCQHFHNPCLGTNFSEISCVPISLPSQ